MPAACGAYPRSIGTGSGRREETSLYQQLPKDVYVEARVKRRTGFKEIFTLVMTLIMLGILFVIMLMVAPMMGNYAFISWAIYTFVLVYAWKFTKKMSVEYEYIFTNGDLDIDKILGREDRKRRYSVKCADMEFFEPYTTPSKYEHMKFDRIAFPCSSSKAKGLYCFAFRDRTYGRCLIVIDMTDELRQAIEDSRPRQYGNLK